MANRETERQLQEAYHHIKPYMDEDEMLKALCQNCPMKKEAQKSQYKTCLNKACFKCYLAYVYLNWYNSSDGY